MMETQKKARGKVSSLLAATTTALLVASGLALVPAAANAEDPTPAEWTPALEVFLADGVTPVADTAVHAGDELVVKGSGFDPAANVGGRGMPIPDTLPQGSYIVFGSFAQNWQPSAGAPSSDRSVGSQGWALTSATVDAVPEVYKPIVQKEWVNLAADGTFTWNMTVANPPATVAGGKFGIYSYGAGGVKNASQEKFVPINYVEPTRPTVTLSASPSNSAAIGSPVTLTATVSVGAETPTGTVEFFNNKKSLGAAKAVSNGSASISVPNLPLGAAKFTANYTPDQAAVQKYGASKSSELAYDVNKIASSVALTAVNSLPSATAASETHVTLNATVTLASAVDGAGTVTFFDGATQLGAPQALTGNNVALDLTTLKLGAHEFTAKYSPTDAARIEGSTSDKVKLNVTGRPKPPSPKISFTDVTKGDKFFKEISWMAETGLSTGNMQADGTRKYLPADSVSRQAMAAFLYREAKADFKGPEVSPFADVKPGDKFYKEITWMYENKISTGTRQPSGKPLFKPQDGISREAMAAFMYRMNKDAKPVEPKVSPFADVAPSDKFYKEIAWMFTSKLSTGTKQETGKPRYEAKSNVSRMAMAAFLYRKAHTA